MDINRVPIVKRTSIYNRIPLILPKLEYESCTICERSCNNTKFCDVSTPKEYDSESFRLIRVTDEPHDQKYWNEFMRHIDFVKGQESFLRIVSDCSIPDEVIHKVSYSTYNVIQFNVRSDLIQCCKTDSIKRSIFVADNCGLYISVMIYPIIPIITKVSELLEFLSSMRYSCNTVCFKFIELPVDHTIKYNNYVINGNVVPKEYFQNEHDLITCSEEYKQSFCTIFTQFLEPRKINCSLCNDKACY